jgi:DNA primase
MTDSSKAIRPRVVVPFTHNQHIVGCTSRYLDDRQPKYINDAQQGYVFGVDLQQDDWQYAIVVEGIFDALSINGLAVMHNDINQAQAQLIKNLERSIIVVPDYDKAGLTLIDRAIELGWAVSIPDWPEGIKDINDAVVKLGRVATLLIILQAKETSKIKIEIRKKHLAKRIRN